MSDSTRKLLIIRKWQFSIISDSLLSDWSEKRSFERAVRL